MRTAVHTRKIIDPSAGLKLTGAQGRHTFGVLSSADASPEGSRQRAFTVVREVMNFGRGRYAGLLVSDTEFGKDHNRVVGGDVAFKQGENSGECVILPQLGTLNARRPRPGCTGLLRLHHQALPSPPGEHYAPVPDGYRSSTRRCPRGCIISVAFLSLHPITMDQTHQPVVWVWAPRIATRGTEIFYRLLCSSLHALAICVSTMELAETYAD